MILLITGCIKPFNVEYLALTDEKIRLKEYINSIKYAICNSKFDSIVFCENSNYAYDYNELFILAKEYNKQLEILSFLGNASEQQKHGKGYGEGEIIDYIIRNSQLIKKEEFFCKITGRLIVENFNKIIKNNNKCIFNRNYYTKASVDTRLYCCSMEIYERYFRDAYKRVDDASGRYMEVVFFDILNANHINYSCFSRRVAFKGVSGSSGIEYGKEPLWYKIVLDIVSIMNIFNSDLIQKLLIKMTYKFILVKRK